MVLTGAFKLENHMFRSLLTTAAASAETAGAKANDAGPIASAKISLDAAVGIAEKHVNGKAVRAEYEEQKDGRSVYDVEVKADNAVSDVKVDPDKGAVIASTADQADADNDGDKAD
jgi:uncharacterized membrane protein YkoI